MSEHPTVFPTMSYRDADAAIDFLQRAFGAEPHAVYRDDEGRVRHAELRLGNGMVMLGPAESAQGGGVYVVVPDPDEHCVRAREAGAEIVREPNDTDYGSREYGARDPEGLAWHFGTSQPFEIAPPGA
jgi:uncharacterized glyoxalase superfamily protein PhnB